MADEFVDTKTDLAGLKRWIEVREAHEATAAHPIPLTSAERKAIRVLQPAPAIQNEADLDQEDWISLLKMYQDTHPGLRHVYREAPAGVQVWRCTCIITYQGLNETFPRDEEASAKSNESASIPTFARKKDAKRYAARLAYLWLRQRDLPGSFGPLPSHSPAPAPASTPARALVTDQGPTTAPATKRRREDKDPLATEQVTKLCAKLGIKAPQYDLSQTKIAGYWNGTLKFDHDQNVPDDLGTVSNIYGRDGAKQLMAQKCHKWLVDLEAERDWRFKSLMGAEETA